MKKIKAIGIDYSLNSPALCIASGYMSFKNCKFNYLSSKKKYIGQFDNITGTEYPEWSDPIENVLIIDPMAEMFIIGSEIDYVNELGGSYLKIVNPMQTSSCGCGASFGV